MSRKRLLGIVLVVGVCSLSWSGYRALRQAVLDHDLLAASTAGDLSKVRILINRGADPNAGEAEIQETGWRHLIHIFWRHKQNASYIYPLSQALREETTSNSLEVNRVEIVRMLLEHGANPNILLPEEKPLPLRIWPDTSDEKLLTLLLQHGTNPNTATNEGESMLMWAADLHKASLVQAVLAHGAKPNREDNYGNTALIRAASNLDIETIQLLLASGADVNHKDKKGHSALLYAVISEPMEEEERPPSNRQIIPPSGHINPMFRFFREKRNRLLADRKRQKVLDMLLAAGADVNAQDRQGGTPFLFALSETRDTVNSTLIRGIDMRPWVNVNSMLAHGADIHRAIPLSTPKMTISWKQGEMYFYDVPGTTPLMFAVVSQTAEVVSKMLELGADVNARDAEGKTALYYAETYYGHSTANASKILALLRHAGAHR